MKYILYFSIVAALLGGCAIVPLEYGDHHDGYYQDRGYHRDGYYQDRGYHRGDAYYQQRDHSRGNGNDHDDWHHGSQGDPFWDRGS